MRIGFDGKRVAQNSTGLGNYSRSLLEMILKYNPEHQLYLYIPNRNKLQHLSRINEVAPQIILRFPEHTLDKKFSSYWRLTRIRKDIQKDKIELFHGLSGELPLGINRSQCKQIVTIHDVIFRSHPHFYHPMEYLFYHWKVQHICRVADRIIAISKFTKQQIVKYYHVEEEKIDVVYQTCSPQYAEPISKRGLENVRKKYSLPKEYILYVGTIEERKNLLLIAKSLNYLKESNRLGDIHVVVVGKDKKEYLHKVKEYIAQKSLGNRFIFFQDFPFEDLPALYRIATIFVYPSRIEGFGLPMLEAIMSGTPAIGCTGSCLEEAGGEHSLYVSPDNEVEMGEAIDRLWNDENLRSEMSNEGKIYAQNFAGEKTCQRLMEVYQKTMNGK
ncbi:MAG TPA: glycosyltransferase family 1 protein [Porphyromonadaceae bacterium]|nr:glycosyltransferase family 1 protein [Porphyromonadaceae bacterium]